jgi:hypothetical protein
MFVNLTLISFKIYEIMLHYEIMIHHFDPNFFTIMLMWTIFIEYIFYDTRLT